MRKYQDGMLVDASPAEEAKFGVLAQESSKFRLAKSALFAKLEAERKRMEEGGIVVGGVPIRTDIASQGRIAAAARSLDKGHGAKVRWKCSDGVYRELTPAQMFAVEAAVFQHVQACFAAAEAHEAAIAALADLAACAGYDVTQGWPGS